MVMFYEKQLLFKQGLVKHETGFSHCEDRVIVCALILTHSVHTIVFPIISTNLFIKLLYIIVSLSLDIKVIKSPSSLSR